MSVDVVVCLRRGTFICDMKRVAKRMQDGPDLLSILEIEKNHKLEGYKELLRLSLIQRDAIRGGDVSRVADILMLKHEIIRELGDVEARIGGIQQAIADSLNKACDACDQGTARRPSPCQARDMSSLDREITAIMYEVMLLEEENRRELERQAGCCDDILRGPQPA